MAIDINVGTIDEAVGGVSTPYRASLLDIRDGSNLVSPTRAVGLVFDALQVVAQGALIALAGWRRVRAHAVSAICLWVVVQVEVVGNGELWGRPSCSTTGVESQWGW